MPNESPEPRRSDGRSWLRERLPSHLPGLLKVARTVADLAGSKELRPSHLAEAAQYPARGVRMHFS